MSTLGDRITHMPLKQRLVIQAAWSTLVLAAVFSIPSHRVVVITMAFAAAAAIAVFTTIYVLLDMGRIDAANKARYSAPPNN